MILHLDGYDLKGFYSLEEYYARDLPGYYKAIAVGPSHNYYEGRREADIIAWLDYFCRGMAEAFQRVMTRAQEAMAAGVEDQSPLLRRLDPRQHSVLDLFQKHQYITARQVANLFGVTPRTARYLCGRWVKENFIRAADPARKSRTYLLAEAFAPLISAKRDR